MRVEKCSEVEVRILQTGVGVCPCMCAPVCVSVCGPVGECVCVVWVCVLPFRLCVALSPSLFVYEFISFYIVYERRVNVVFPIPPLQSSKLCITLP